MSEQQLFDLGTSFIRTRLVTIPGCAIPWPYGGKQRQIMVDLDPALLQAKSLSPNDVVTALNNQNLILPSGTAKIGGFEYDARSRAALVHLRMQIQILLSAMVSQIPRKRISVC